MKYYKAILLKDNSIIKDGYTNEYLLRDRLELDGYKKSQYKIISYENKF